MIIDAVKKYIETCPLLKRGKINVNYLGDEPVKYSIDTVPASPVVKRYTDGGELRQFLFVFASREAYDANALENMKVSQFFEEFENWVSTQDIKRIYPVFDDKKLTATKIETVTSGYMYDVTRTTARFQIQLKLTYRKDV